jgi:hypothetical protein
MRRSLENRLVFCVDCEANQALWLSSSGSLVCGRCGSSHWMFISVPILARFKEYNEPAVLERRAVDRYIRHLEKQETFSSKAELV